MATEKVYVFRPEFLEFSDESFMDLKLHKFQTEIRDVTKSGEDCLFVNAPTGSGKTLAFSMPTFCNFIMIRRVKTLIISPTNVLISQINEDINLNIKKYKELNNVKTRVINSKTINSRNLIQRGEEIRNSFTQNDILISNPDMISLLLSGFYQSSRSSNRDIKKSLRNPEDILSQINVVIFDEYHVYDEEELGKIIAFIAISSLTGNKIKFIFSSATPESKIFSIIEILKLKYKVCDVKTTNEDGGNSRKIKGEIRLEFTDIPIFESFKENSLSNPERTLYLFDHKITAEMAINYLLDNSINENQIQELTGISQRSEGRRNYSGKEKFVIATNSAEQGLNLETNRAHIEPGMYTENLSQRYGRIGRQGSSGLITVHTDKSISTLLLCPLKNPIPRIKFSHQFLNSFLS